MNEILFFLKGIVIGLIIGMPIGAVGAVTLNRALNYGIKVGLITGLGSSTADCLYAAVGAFGITVISDFIIKHQTIINILGGILVCGMGMSAFYRKDPDKKGGQLVNSLPMMYITAFFIGITNPAAIVTFLFAFSYFEISAGMNPVTGTMLVAGVMAGTFVWWLALSFFASRFKEKAIENKIMIDRIFGVLLVVLGAGLIIRTLI